MGQRRTIDVLHHGVNDGLGVYHHVNAVNAEAKESGGLEYFETFVHERRRVDRNLRPHGPRGVCERVGFRHVLQFAQTLRTKRAARRRQEQSLHRAIPVGRISSSQTLVNGTVLGVNGD